MRSDMLPIERSYGVVVVLRKPSEADRFLMLFQTYGAWSLPKGHGEGTESPKEAALRELKEETGITEVTLLDIPPIEETHEFSRDGVRTQKINQFFVASVSSDEVTIQPEEVSEYKWATYEKALSTFTYENPKEVLRKVVISLKNYE